MDTHSARLVMMGSLVLAVAFVSVGCGRSALQAHMNIATVTAVTISEAEELVVVAHGEALGEVRDETEGMPRSAREAALRAESDRWVPADASLDSIRAAYAIWVSSINLAHSVDTDQDLLVPLLRMASRLVASYEAAVTVARSLGVSLPELPPSISDLLSSFGGES